MTLIFLTTSHLQENQVESAYSQITLSLPNDILRKSVFVVVESSGLLFQGLRDEHRFKPKFHDVSIVPVPSRYFWTNSVLSGLSHIRVNYPELISAFSRVVLFNSDISFTGWCSLTRSKSILESFVSADSSGVIEPSGFNMEYPFPFNKYPFVGKHLREASDFLVQVVPTRLVSFPSMFIADISIYQFLTLLPHYGADFALTFLLSRISYSRWLVRVDQHLIEDKFSTGIKQLSHLSFVDKLRQLFNIKSTFFLPSNLLYPLVIERIRGASFCSCLFILLAFLKFLVRYATAFLE